MNSLKRRRAKRKEEREEEEEMEEGSEWRGGDRTRSSFGRYLMDCIAAVGNYGTRSLTPHHPILAFAAVAFVPFALYPL